MSTEPDDTRAAVERLWDALGRRDFAAIGSCMSERGHYLDVAAMELDPGAVGPAETEARVRLALEPLAAYELHDGPIIVEGSTAITEHSETWTWASGESVVLRFVSVVEVHDGKVDRWWDYWDLATIMNAAPAAWLEHIAGGYR